jgi:hypothetical protein
MSRRCNRYRSPLQISKLVCLVEVYQYTVLIDCLPVDLGPVCCDVLTNKHRCFLAAQVPRELVPCRVGSVNQSAGTLPSYEVN